MKRFCRGALAGTLWILFLPSLLYAEADPNALLLEVSTLINTAHKVEKDSYAEAYKYYKTAIEKAEQFVSEHPSSDTARQVIQGTRRIGPYTLKELKEVIVHQIRKKADAEVDPIEAILLLIEKTTDAAYRDYALNRIIRIYKRRGQIDKAVEIALTRTRLSERPYFLINLAHDLAAQGKKKEALDLLEKATLQPTGQFKENWQIEQRGVTLTNIASAYIHLKEPDRARVLLQQSLPMVHSTSALSGLAVSYSELGEKEKADALFTKAKALKKPSDASSLGLDFARAGRYEEAGQMLQEIDTLSQKVGLLVSLYGVATQRGDDAVGSRFLREAIEGAKREKRSYEETHKAQQWLKFARQAREVGEMKWALRFSKKAQQSIDAVFGNPRNQETLLISLAEEYLKLGEPQRAGALLDRVENNNHTGGSTWDVTLPEMYAQIGEVKQALHLIEKSEDNFSKVKARLNVAEVLWNKGNHNDALPLLTKSESELQEAKSTGEPWISFEMIRLASQYAALGQTSAALRVLAEAENVVLIRRDPFGKTSALIGIARGYITLNQIEQAEQVFSKAVEITNQTREDGSGSRLYRQIASVYAETGLFQRALEAAAQINEDETKAYAWIDIANQQLGSNQTAIGRELLIKAVGLLQKKNPREDAEIVQALIAAEEIDKALRLVEELKHNNEKINMLSSVFISDPKLDLLLWSKTSISRITSLLKNLETKDISGEDRVILGALWAKLGEHQEAERLFARAESQVKSSSSPLTEYEPLRNIAVTLIDLAQPEEALSVAVEIKDPLQRIHTFRHLMWSLIDQKKKEKARSLMVKMEEAAEEITDPSQRSQALFEIAEKWIALGEHEKGLTIINELIASRHPSTEFRDDVYTAAAYIQAGERDTGMDILEHALQRAKEDHSTWENVIRFGEMIFPLAEAGEIDRRGQRFLHTFLQLAE